MANADVFDSGFSQGLKKGSKGKSEEDPTKLGTAIKTPSYKKGGKVRKTGLARLHKGEIVVPVKKANKKTHKKVACKR